MPSPGMRSEEEILKSFANLDNRPGSRQKRVDSNPSADKRRAQLSGESNGWDANPIVKTLFGEETEVFTIGALADALEKKVVTIRLWEKKGYIPTSPYRLRSKTLNGEKVSGNRVYTRELIEIAIEEFSKRKLLGSARVEWKNLRDLTDTLVRRWRQATQRNTTT